MQRLTQGFDDATAERLRSIIVHLMNDEGDHGSNIPDSQTDVVVSGDAHRPGARLVSDMIDAAPEMPTERSNGGWAYSESHAQETPMPHFLSLTIT